MLIHISQLTVQILDGVTIVGDGMTVMIEDIIATAQTGLTTMSEAARVELAVEVAAP